MSDLTKTVDETTEVSEIKQAAMDVPATVDPAEATKTIVGGEPTPIPTKDVKEEILSKNEVLVEATPASEGVLGYKAPGFLKSLHFSKYYFWFGDEPLKSESLAAYVRSEKLDVAHHVASWAQETGKGLLFYTKRSEDKATPSGIIPLSEVSNVTKEGDKDFSFKAGKHIYRFQAATSDERASWVVAVQKKAEEAKTAQDGIVGSEGYKKNMESYAKSPALVGAAAARSKIEKSTSRPAKKSLDGAAVAATPTDGAAEEPVAKEEKATTAAKSRSQSRKRTSIFGSLLAKKDERDDQKEVKKEEKAEEKAEKAEEKRQIKEEKKADASTKKEEVEAAAISALPAAVVVAAEKKHEDNKEEQKDDAITPTDKRGKRSSVFGGLFGKKTVTSPTAEKAEQEAAPAVPAKDSEVLPVSETAPKLEEPIENKPIDTAAVTAPADTVTAAAAEEAPKEVTDVPADTATKTEKKGGFLGFIKKTEAILEGKKEAKTDAKEEAAAEKISKDPVAAAAVEPTPAATETPAAAATEERPVRDKRRTSLFGGLGTQKKKTSEATESDAAPSDAKREKSPLPQKLGGLFRKPSKAVKMTEKKEATAATEEAAIPEKSETVTKEPVSEKIESAIVGDVVPEELHSTVHDIVPSAPREIEASA